MKKTEIAKTILYGVAAVTAVAGVVVVAAALPGAAMAFRVFHKPLDKYEPSQVKRSFDYLQKKKLIGIGKEGSKTVIKLTRAGEERLLQYQLEDLKLKRQKQWDKKFRLVFFDIPEKYRYARQMLCKKLRELGFALMQKSVWICPHPCQDEIEFLAGVYEIDPFIKVITVDSKELEYYWQKKFNLK